MGLDWRPMPKPKPGFEKKYVEIFNILTGKEKPNMGIWDRIKGKQPFQREILSKDIWLKTNEGDRLKRLKELGE